MYILSGFILGSILGSFSLSLADRALSGKSFWGRSICSFCGKKLSFLDLIPIFSYLILRGKCRFCHKKLSPGYLAVEILSGILIAILFWQSSFATFQVETLIFKIFFVTILVSLLITDLKKMLIPDRIIIPALVISLVFLLAEAVISQNIQPLAWSILSGLSIGLFFMTLILLTQGKGMGGGDVKLGVFMGLILSFPNSYLALVLSFLSGALVAVALLISGKKRFGETLPFGPFLVIGAIISLFWGDLIIDWYLKLSL